jgi:hypothetical protein
MREAETIDFLEVLDTNIKRIDRLIQLLDAGRRAVNFTSSELRDFRLADQAADEARDMIEELFDLEQIISAQQPLASYLHWLLDRPSSSICSCDQLMQPEHVCSHPYQLGL